MCERSKTGHKKDGQLAPRIAPAVPWHEVHVDSVGPWHCPMEKPQNKYMRSLVLIW